MAHDRSPGELLRATLAAVAPGTELRDGLERILRGRTGALIVLGYDRVVEELCTGGFVLDVEFSATRLRELAKMDGAVVTRRGAHAGSCGPPSTSCPTPSIETEESGTRHRTAERVAKQTGYPGHLGQPVDADRRALRRRPAVRARGLDAILSRPTRRWRPWSATSPASTRSPARSPRSRSRTSSRSATSPIVVQRLEMVRRIAEEIARLRRRARHRRPAAVAAARRADRPASSPTASWSSATTSQAARRERSMSTTCSPSSPPSPPAELLDLTQVARVLGFSTAGDALDAAVSPSGYRLLTRSRGCPAPSSTGWSTTSAACRSCSRPASTTS